MKDSSDMRCDVCQQQFEDLLAAGAIPPLEIVAHLEACRVCRVMLDYLVRLRRLAASN